MFQLGYTAWRIEKADAFAFLVDGDCYFRALGQTLPLARHSIRIIGWDFDPDIRLSPRDAFTLGEFLRELVERAPELHIHILVWAMGPVYSGHSLKLFTQSGWSNHPRIHLRFDSRHALRGSHHQKLVTVDDRVALAGGIDLTAGRWDSCQHRAECPDRVKPNGTLYGPVHDVQAMFSGQAASAAAELARWRWKKATGEEHLPAPGDRTPWPQEIVPDMENCTVAIGRTVPSLPGMRHRRESVRLTRASIAAARRHIYIESQYLASFRIGKALAGRLKEPDGPEILILVTMSSRGWLEQFVMARNRDRLLRRLNKADRHNRLRVMYLVVPREDGGECEVLIHSKVLIVDDRLVRIGSSNLNNRSEGLDTECDVAVEAHSDRDRQAIAGFRDRLLAEHLDASPAEVSRAIAERGSLIGAMERLNRKPRGMRPYKVRTGDTSPLFGTSLLDPERTFRPIHGLLQFLGSAFERFLRALFGNPGPLAQKILAGNEQRHADGERNEEVDQAKGDDSADHGRALRQQIQDGRLQHSEPAGNMAYERRHIADDIDRGDLQPGDIGKSGQELMQAAGNAGKIDAADKYLRQRQTQFRHLDAPAPDPQLSAHED